MAKVVIREVGITESGLNLTVEFDFELVSGAGMVTYTFSVSKPEYLYWKETADPAANGVLDYITMLVKPHYEKLLAQKTLAAQLGLKDQEITW